MATPAQDGHDLEATAARRSTVPSVSAVMPGPSVVSQFTAAWRRHWPEYAMEFALLGMFMVSACGFTALLEHPASPVRQAISAAWLRRMLGGVAMGATAIALIYSPWGKQSGAHFNPAVTLTFFRLGKVERWDALFYMVSQFAGGVAGVVLAVAVLGQFIRHPSVNYVVTVPGAGGTGIALLAEFLISCGLMAAVLFSANNARLARFTGVFAGLLVALYISVEAPLSGMSMNPARTFGSAFPSSVWTAVWIYFMAPPLGMLFAAELYQWRHGDSVICAKLHHHNSKRCIFRCGYRKEERLQSSAGDCQS